MSLPRHHFRAEIPKLNAGIGMDTVVDAAVTGLITARHPRIGGIDDRVAAKRRNVSLPKPDPVLDGLQLGKLRDSLFADRLAQIVVLYPEKIAVDPPGHTQIA